jgi:hypothetical protein
MKKLPLDCTSNSLGLLTRRQLLNLLNETCGILSECVRKLMERFIRDSRRLMREMNRVPISRWKTSTAALPSLARYIYTTYWTSHLSLLCLFNDAFQSHVLYSANKLWRIRNEAAGTCFKTLPHWHGGLRRAGVLHRSSQVHASLLPELLARPARPTDSVTITGNLSLRS